MSLHYGPHPTRLAGEAASGADCMLGSRYEVRGKVQQLAAQAFQTLLNMDVVSAGSPAPAILMMAAAARGCLHSA